MALALEHQEGEKTMEKEMRLIDANKCPCNTCRTQYCGDPRRCTNFMMWLHYDPVDATPVIHGKWIFDFSLDDMNFYKCSVCGRQEVLLAKECIEEDCPYCNCGAKMGSEPSAAGLRNRTLED